jgi:hypothetical protein
MAEKIVKSSIIQAYEYDSSKQELLVTFKNNSTWKYTKVSPVEMSEVFDRPGSIGSRFLSKIKRSKQGTEQP